MGEPDAIGALTNLYELAASNPLTGSVVQAAADYGDFALLQMKSVFARLGQSLALSVAAEFCIFLICCILARLVWTYLSRLLLAASSPGLSLLKELAFSILSLAQFLVIIALAVSFHVQSATMVRQYVRGYLSRATGLPQITATLPVLLDQETGLPVTLEPLPPLPDYDRSHIGNNQHGEDDGYY